MRPRRLFSGLKNPKLLDLAGARVNLSEISADNLLTKQRLLLKSRF